MTTDRAVLSIDFELFRHTPAYRSASGELTDEAVGLRAWPFLRDLLEDHGVTTTFFVVGEIAREHSDVVAQMDQYGHEVASHTQSHHMLSSLDIEKQTAELIESRETLRELTGQKITGFRAPAFDLPTGTFQRLSNAGYTYDSSVIPARRIPGWYGGMYSVKEPCTTEAFERGKNALNEIPVSVMPGLRLPLSGAWTRLFGQTYTRIGMKRIAANGGIPVLYFHPWEMVDLPRIEGVPKRVTWRTGPWLRETIDRMLAMDFEFVTLATVVEEEIQ